MPCLALATAELAISHAQFLFAVAVKGFRACPTLSVGVQDAFDFPTRAIGYQDLGHGLITTLAPQEDDPHGMLHLRQADPGGVVPLALVAATQFPTLFAGNRRGPLVRSDRLAADLQLAIGLQIADVGPRIAPPVQLAVDVVEVLRTGKIAVKREIAGNLVLADPVNQLAKQSAMVLELFAGRLAL